MDPDSFRQFYGKTMPTLRAYILQRCGGIELADDILQEAFFRFLRSAPSTLTEAQMRAYLYRTAENLIINRWHGLQREQAFAGTLKTELSHTPAPDVTNALEHALSQLDSRQQTLLWLAYVEGFDHKEIAAAANVGRKSVRVLLFRAKQKLLAILDEMGIHSENR
jgi:RNA polymerase sigma-70 factor (ECF subfamily)